MLQTLKKILDWTIISIVAVLGIANLVGAVISDLPLAQKILMVVVGLSFVSAAVVFVSVSLFAGKSK